MYIDIEDLLHITFLGIGGIPHVDQFFNFWNVN